MSKMKMMAAKELISEKRYNEARGILRAVDHPTAVEWLEKLDKIDPPSAMQKILRAVLPKNAVKNNPTKATVPRLTRSKVDERIAHSPVSAPMALPIVEEDSVNEEEDTVTSTSIYPNHEKRTSFPKAVAGEFDGIEFRSQLEIRFAAELKKRNIEYKYESARIGKGKYMIDFYLPTHGIWVEVKGKMDARDEYMLQECAKLLSEQRTETLYIYSSDRKMHLVHDNELEYLWPGKFWEMLEALQSEK